MTRAIRLSTREAMAAMETTLAKYVGVVAAIANHQHLLEGLLDYYLLEANPTHYQRVSNALDPYGIPTEVRHQLLKRLLEDIARLIQRGFGLLYPSKNYTYVFEDMDTLVVLEQDVPTPCYLGKQTVSGHDGYGDFIPERLRR